jgi:hypothetical protein
VRRALAAAAATLALASPASAAPQLTGVWTGSGSMAMGEWYSPVPLPGDVYVTVSGPVAIVGGGTASCSGWWWEDPSGYATGRWFAGGLSCSGAFTASAPCVSQREALVVHLVCPTFAHVMTATFAITPSDLLPTRHFEFRGTVTYAPL